MTAPVIINDELEMVDPTTLLRHPENPWQGDLGEVVQSIEHHGFFGALIVQRSSRFVLDGNHRLMAAQHLGMKEVPVIWVDVDDRQGVKMLLIANRLTQKGSYDDNALAEILSMLAVDTEGLAGTGFDGDDLDDLIAQANEPLDVGGKKPKTYNVTVRCADADEQTETLQKLLGAGYDARAR